MIDRRSLIIDMLLIGGATVILPGCTRRTRIQSPNTNNPTIKELCLQVLDEIRSNGTLPPISARDIRFPLLVDNKIRRGALYIEMGERPPHIYAEYSPTTNTIVINSVFGQNPLLQKEAILHELYHAHQDAIQLRVYTLSEAEGPAYLLSIKYLLHALGYRQANQAAEDDLMSLLINQENWLSTFTPEQFSVIVLAALTQDRTMWDLHAIAIGRTYVKIKLLTETILPMLRETPQTGSLPSLAPFPLRLGNNGTTIQININPERAHNLITMATDCDRAETPAEIQRTLSILYQYWIREVLPSAISPADFLQYDHFMVSSILNDGIRVRPLIHPSQRVERHIIL